MLMYAYFPTKDILVTHIKKKKKYWIEQLTTFSLNVRMDSMGRLEGGADSGSIKSLRIRTQHWKINYVKWGSDLCKRSVNRLKGLEDVNSPQQLSVTRKSVKLGTSNIYQARQEEMRT